MFKKRKLVTAIVGLALLAAVTGTPQIVADSLGLPLTPQAQACTSAGHGGGGC